MDELSDFVFWSVRVSRLTPLKPAVPTHCAHLTSLILVWMSLVSLAPSAHANEPDWKGTLAAESHVGVLQEDVFLGLYLQLNQSFALPQVGARLLPSEQRSSSTALSLSLQAPLRLRLADRAPVQGTLLREQDWDQPRDVLRVLRRLAYGEAGSPLHIQAGELNSITLLDGQLIANYYNVVSPDEPATGVVVSSSTRSYDAALMLGDVLSPSVMAAEIKLRPATIFNAKHNFLRRFALGVGLTSDIQAPTALALDERGFIEVDATSSPSVLESQATWIGGPELQAWLVTRPKVSLSFESSVFWHDRLGRGEHVGLSLQLMSLYWMKIQLKSSVVFAHDRYVPHYISPLYQVERFQVDGFGVALPETKLQAVAGMTPRDDMYVDSSFTLVLPTLQSSLFINYLHSNVTPMGSAVTAKLDVAPHKLVNLSAFYHQNLFDGPKQALKLRRSLIGSELRVMPWGPLYAVARYDRLWRLRDDGLWSSVQNWNIGVGAQWAFEAYTR